MKRIWHFFAGHTWTHSFIDTDGRLRFYLPSHGVNHNLNDKGPLDRHCGCGLIQRLTNVNEGWRDI